MNLTGGMDDSGKRRIFVYGTLRRGNCHHQILRRLHAQFSGDGYVKGRLYDLKLYPGARKGGGPADRVRGEIYLLPEAKRALKVLDKFEGFNQRNPPGSLFQRELTVVNLANGDSKQAWIYWLHRGADTMRWVRSGDYRQASSGTSGAGP